MSESDSDDDFLSADEGGDESNKIKEDLHKQDKKTLEVSKTSNVVNKMGGVHLQEDKLSDSVDLQTPIVTESSTKNIQTDVQSETTTEVLSAKNGSCDLNTHVEEDVKAEIEAEVESLFVTENCGAVGDQKKEEEETAKLDATDTSKILDVEIQSETVGIDLSVGKNSVDTESAENDEGFNEEAKSDLTSNKGLHKNIEKNEFVNKIDNDNEKKEESEQLLNESEVPFSTSAEVSLNLVEDKQHLPLCDEPFDEGQTLEKPSGELLASKEEQKQEDKSNVDDGKEIRHQDKSTGNKILNDVSNSIDESSKPAAGGADNKTSPDENWGWDSWADDFLLQTATKVSSLLETVENQLGIPDPMVIAKNIKKDEEERNGKEAVVEENADDHDKAVSTTEAAGVSSWFSSFVPVAAITNLVQSTGTEIVSGGIDALEFIGKKTVNMLADGDPGLRNTRDSLVGQKPNLSSILNEARLKNEQHERSSTAVKGEDPAKFNDMFEKYQGIAHLDALEMLSSECESKLERILDVQSDEAKDESTELMADIQKRFEFKEEKEENNDNKDTVDFKKEIYLVSKKLKLKVTCAKILNTWSKVKEKSEKCTELENVCECYEATVMSLAEFLSRCVEYYRKVADLLMLTDMQAKTLGRERALALCKITNLFDAEISQITNTYAEYLIGRKDENASRLVTDVYLEGSNCSTLLQDGHQLLLPILQLSVIK